MSDTATTDKPKTDLPPPAEAEKPKLPSLRAGGSLTPIVPQDFDQAYRMARVIAMSGTAPKSYMVKDPVDLKEYLSVERIAVAIMAGLEVGLPPMQAVQGIAVINGMPTVYGDARDGLIAASGLLEDMKEEMEVDEQGLFLWARCTIWRKGRKTPISQTITRPQAARAGWLKKTGPWQDSPNRMAQMRAKGWASRDAFPDVLKGLIDHDEAVDMAGMVDVTHRGSVTTAPPPPRRTDFQATPAASNETAADEPEGDVYPLFDETGAQLGEFAPAAWYAAFTDEIDRMTGPARSQFLENNADAAKEVWSDLESDEAAAQLKALYEPKEPAADEPATKDWSLPDNIVGQEKKLLAIYQMLDGKREGGPNVETSAEVDALWEAHEAFFEKLGQVKKAAANQRFGDRKIELAQANAA